MKAFHHAVATATLILLPVVSALASQGPGTTGGTATALDKGMFLAAMALAIGVGVVLRLRHR